MRLLPSDPDVETIVSRIKKNDINLQPDFQRGEVWGLGKRQRLIDSILREWHVPPIHVIEVKKTAKQEVLDGQQRLVSIRDFVNGDIKVDGNIEPLDDEIQSLHGMTYETLPEEWRRKFDRFTIRVFRITDYGPEEPGELFFRLNQPSNLTAAEQRNAYFGTSRQQIKQLVTACEQYGLSKDFIGFSNSRMAYDDVLARLCYSLDAGTLQEKVTAGVLAAKYRSNEGFSPYSIERAEEALRTLGSMTGYVRIMIKFNKATLYSWLWFLTECRELLFHHSDPALLGEFLTSFEAARFKLKATRFDDPPITRFSFSPPILYGLFTVYNDRSSARVADVSSVLSRDVVIWLLFLAFLSSRRQEVSSDNPKIKYLQAKCGELKHSLDHLDVEDYINMIIYTMDSGEGI